ncbi:MAG: helix-turn-helix domain-containing protein [Salinivirgaceae bacterium]|nr:helix-turn-helix domain-containing protein [Salinivirgaceae bacterium]
MSEPKSIGEILADYFTNSQEPFAVAFRNYIASSTHQTNQENISSPVLPANVTSPLTGKLVGWLDNQDVMQILHISPRTLQTLRANGTLPFSRIKGKFYYKVSDLVALLESNYTANLKKPDSYGN